MHSRDVIKHLQKDGWYEVNQVGSHKQFKHPVKKGRVTVPHPNGTYRSALLEALRNRQGSN